MKSIKKILVLSLLLIIGVSSVIVLSACTNNSNLDGTWIYSFNAGMGTVKYNVMEIKDGGKNFSYATNTPQSADEWCKGTTEVVKNSDTGVTSLKFTITEKAKTGQLSWDGVVIPSMTVKSDSDGTTYLEDSNGNKYYKNAN